MGITEIIFSTIKDDENLKKEAQKDLENELYNRGNKDDELEVVHDTRFQKPPSSKKPRVVECVDLESDVEEEKDSDTDSESEKRKTATKKHNDENKNKNNRNRQNKNKTND